ncbi:MAG: hypothetical protein J6U21_09440 [Bacteroidales bacterium]|nr:hypothetical protein [Bacteroidales bacterium]
MTIHSPGQLIVDVEDISLLKNLKNAISMLKGVAKVTIPRRQKLSSYELALKDLDEGRVYEAKDVDDLFNQIFSGNDEEV